MFDYLQDILLNVNHKFLESLHLIAVICWMAAMLYLPRLFVYHVDAVPGGEFDSKLMLMEKRLLKYIMNPAMIFSLLFGTMLIIQTGALTSGRMWIHYKLLMLLFMFGFHGMCVKYVRLFGEGKNIRTSKYFRIFNEIPTVLMVIIVLLAVMKPF